MLTSDDDMIEVFESEINYWKDLVDAFHKQLASARSECISATTRYQNAENRLHSLKEENERMKHDQTAYQSTIDHLRKRAEEAEARLAHQDAQAYVELLRKQEQTLRRIVADLELLKRCRDG